MQNIDPLYLLFPLVVIGLSFGLVIYWSRKRCFSRWAILYSLLAYAGAIALKYIVQIPTINAVESASGHSPLVLGLYYGIQTGVFEVGGAFLVASYAVSKGRFSSRDGGAFGLGLAMWENGVLIGALTLVNYIAYYAILGAPNSGISQTVYNALVQSSPSLFYGPAKALPYIGYSILERITSLVGHFSWGFLAVWSAVFKKKYYFAVAFPIGFGIDFLVPFEPRLGTGLFELVVFAIAVAGLAVTLAVTRGIRKNMQFVAGGQAATETGQSNSTSPS
jgi:hypothetical protein